MNAASATLAAWARMRLLCFALALLPLLLAPVALAQAPLNLRLTSNGAISYTSQNGRWCVAATGDTVHVVWWDYRDGNWEVYYLRSLDGGSTWGPETRLTNDAGASQYPSVAVSGTTVHVVWWDTRDGNKEIYYKRSTDAGANWGPDTRLTIDASDSYHPVIAASGAVLHVAWYDLRGGNREIYYKRSLDGGATWGPDTRLTIDAADSMYPSLAVSGSTVHVVWYDGRDGNAEIYTKRSVDAGATWGADTRLTYDAGGSAYPSVAAVGSNVHVVWWDDRDGNREIYYKRSTDGGDTWGTDQRLTNDSHVSFCPSVAATDAVVQVVWYDNRDGNFEIYWKRSPNAGTGWGPDTRLTNNASASEYPSVAVSGSAVHAVWQDNRDGNYEIYYWHDPTGNVVGVPGALAPPVRCALAPNRPNPFGRSTLIAFEVPQPGPVTLKVYDLSGREVATLVDEVLEPGPQAVRFEGGGLPSGVYTVRLATIGGHASRRLVLLR